MSSRAPYYRAPDVCPECRHPTHSGRCTAMVDAAPLITARQPAGSLGSGQRQQCTCRYDMDEEES